MGESNGDRGVRPAQTFQPLLMQSRVGVLLRVDNHHEAIHARRQPCRHLGVLVPDRIDVRQVEDDHVAGQRARGLDAHGDAEPLQELAGSTPARQDRARLVRRGAQDADTDHLSPAQRVDESGLSRAGTSQHADHAPLRIALGALGGHVDELADPRKRRGIHVTRGKGADLIKLGGRRRDRVVVPLHASSSPARSRAASRRSRTTASPDRSTRSTRTATTPSMEVLARRSRSWRAWSARERTFRSPK